MFYSSFSIFNKSLWDIYLLKRNNSNGFLKLSVIEMWYKRPKFEKLRRNLRKGFLKGIYWILTGLWVGI